MMLLVTISFFLSEVLGDPIATANSKIDERHEIKKRVVGGEFTEIHMHPWLASIHINNEYTCGGSIISESVILTAAHCVTDQWVRYIVRIGSSDNGNKDLEHKVVAIKRHENYEYSTQTCVRNDLALIKVTPPFKLSGDVIKVHLASKGDEVVPGTVASFAGWGTTTKGGKISPILKDTTLIIVNIAECARIYEHGSGIEISSNRQICASASGKGICEGDSGGPLVVEGVQVGIASWGIGCDSIQYPGVFVNVAHYSDWIVKNLQIMDPPKTESLSSELRPVAEDSISLHASNLKMYGTSIWQPLAYNFLSLI